ncbi:hypothetical protein C4M96_00310 [Mycoplasmopsis pullorum]|uniref:hypothetical protein n=1 Tax=Mycoplasmopsis pullorum TaxID=48003 RepID=UPI0011194559|nr:hypothetical protein [Mycoplasmopsis pullorum]TNK92558.1 hypothetical protein C4M96_00310 [Mycoplasmopsis pullorum]
MEATKLINSAEYTAINAVTVRVEGAIKKITDGLYQNGGEWTRILIHNLPINTNKSTYLFVTFSGKEVEKFKKLNAINGDKIEILGTLNISYSKETDKTFITIIHPNILKYEPVRESDRPNTAKTLDEISKMINSELNTILIQAGQFNNEINTKAIRIIKGVRELGDSFEVTDQAQAKITNVFEHIGRWNQFLSDIKNTYNVSSFQINYKPTYPKLLRDFVNSVKLITDYMRFNLREKVEPLDSILNAFISLMNVYYKYHFNLIRYIETNSNEFIFTKEVNFNEPQELTYEQVNQEIKKIPYDEALLSQQKGRGPIQVEKFNVKESSDLDLTNL